VTFVVIDRRARYNFKNRNSELVGSEKSKCSTCGLETSWPEARLSLLEIVEHDSMCCKVIQSSLALKNPSARPADLKHHGRRPDCFNILSKSGGTSRICISWFPARLPTESGALSRMPPGDGTWGTRCGSLASCRYSHPV
jgi:hypothetical protein